MLDGINDRFVPFHIVKHTTGYSKSKIYKKIREGSFPSPIKDGRSSRWSTAELCAWMAAFAYPALGRVACSAPNAMTLQERS